MVYASGAIYDGKWQHGLKHGKGIYVNPAGEMLFAVFRHGSISGGADMVSLLTKLFSKCVFLNLKGTI